MVGNPTSSVRSHASVEPHHSGCRRLDTPFPSQPEGGRCSPSQTTGTLSTLGLESRGAWNIFNKSDVADFVDLSRCRDKSTYADPETMPTLAGDRY